MLVKYDSIVGRFVWNGEIFAYAPIWTTVTEECRVGAAFLGIPFDMRAEPDYAYIRYFCWESKLGLEASLHALASPMRSLLVFTIHLFSLQHAYTHYVLYTGSETTNMTNSYE